MPPAIRRRVLTAAFLALALLLAVRLSSATAAIADEDYVGVTSDMATFRLVMVDGGDGIRTIEIGAPTNAFTASCFTSGAISPEGIVFGRAGIAPGPDRPVVDPSSGREGVLRITGRVLRDGIVTGDLSISGIPDDTGSSCAPRSFSWAAVARSTTTLPVSGATYRGIISAGESFGGLREAGTVSFVTAADGTSITTLKMAPTAECSTPDLAARIIPVTEGRAAFAEDRNAEASTAYARYRVALAGTSGVGTFYIDRDCPGCRPLAGVFVVEVAAPPATATATATPSPVASAVAPTPISTPVPTAPPAATSAGTFVAQPAFPPTGTRLAQVVFRGGTVAQLDAALTTARSTGAWAQSSDGTFVLYVVGAPSFVNDRFMRTFPNGFATTTALTVVGATPTPTFARPE